MSLARPIVREEMVGLPRPPIGVAARRPFAVVLCALAAACALLVPALAAGSSRGPVSGAWPGGIVRYYDASGWQRTVAAAAARWNAARAGVRLVAVRDRARAQLVIGSLTEAGIAAHCGASAAKTTVTVACAQTGYVPGSRPMVLLPIPAQGEDAMPTALDMRMVVHELGHVLGEHHIPGCAVMNAELDLPGCPMSLLGPSGPPDGPARELCGPFAADVRALARLYDVRVDAARQDAYCVLPGR